MSNTQSSFNFRCSALSFEINPQEPISLAGYINREAPFTGIADPLEVNLLLLNSGNEEVLFISADCLFLNDDLFSGSAFNGNIFAGASHTHYAPSLDKTKPALGKTDEVYYTETKEAIHSGINAVLALAKTSCNMEYKEGKTDLTVNRRRSYRKFNLLDPFHKEISTKMAPDYKGEKDDMLRILLLKNESDKIVSVIWSFACHPTNNPELFRVSASYIGSVRAHLRKRFGQIPILFFQGFSGNISANKKRQKEEERFSPFTQSEYDSWNGIMNSCVDKVLDSKSTAEGLSEMKYSLRTIPLRNVISENPPGIEDIIIRSVEFDPGFMMIGISAEPVVEWISEFNAHFKNKKILFPAGCIGTPFGYLPVGKMIGEGGYEAGGFTKIFGYPDFKFIKEFEKNILN